MIIPSEIPQQEEVYKKVTEVVVDKFKVKAPEKKNCGCGKVSIRRAEFEVKGSDKKKDMVAMYKLIFQNSIGKLLYESNISGHASKSRVVEEKSFKN